MAGAAGGSSTGIKAPLSGNYFNRKSASKSFARSRTLMFKSWARDDTAHQREIKDLRRAGLNPILSTRYGGASNSGPISAQMASQEGVAGAGSGFADAISARLAKADIDLKGQQAATEKERQKNIAEETRRVQLENTGRQVESDLIEAVPVLKGIHSIGKFFAPSAKGIQGASKVMQGATKKAGQMSRGVKARRGKFNHKTGEIK